MRFAPWLYLYGLTISKEIERLQKYSLTTRNRGMHAIRKMQ